MKLLGIRSTARAGRERRHSRSARSCSSMGLRSAPTPSGGCCTQWTSRSRRIGRTLSQASSASVVIVPDATGSLWSLRPSVEGSRPRICPSSVSTVKNASSSVTSKTAVARGGAKPQRSKITIFPPTPKGWRSRMESTMSVAMPVCSSWAPPEKPQSLLSMPSNTGGAAAVGNTIPVPLSSSSSPTPVGPTVRAAKSGSAICSRNSVMRMGCALPSVTILQEPRNGIPSSTDCSARSARTGKACRSRATKWL